MASEWQVVSLADAPVQIIDGDRGKNYPKQSDFSDQGHCLFLNASNVTVQGFNFSQCQYITTEKDQVLRKGRLERNDVVMTTRGTVGNVAFYSDNVPFDHIRINSGMVIFRADRNRLSPLFLYQALRSKLFGAQVATLRTGSAQPQLPIRDINRIRIPIPPFQKQQAIACILGALDDKIELNRRMNETLEAMARTIFKSWFVDFDPVREKMERKAAKMQGRKEENQDDSFAPLHPGALVLDPAIADLFPNEFEESELGEIPKGWKVVSVGEVCELAYGKALKASMRKPGEVLVMGSNGQVGWHDTPLAAGPGIIVGRKGNPGVVTWVNSDFFPIDTTFYVVPRLTWVPLPYLYYSLMGLGLPNLSADSAVPGLNRNIAYMSWLLLPSREILEVFARHARLIMDRVNQGEQENRTLAALHDALLPRLISGELRVPDAEKLVEAAV